MAEAVPDLEMSRLAVTDSDDEEVTLMIRKMTYEEVLGKRDGVFYHTELDNHLYRFNRPAKNNKKFVYCYHVKLTKDAEVKEKCKGFGVIDPGKKFDVN